MIATFHESYIVKGEKWYFCILLHSASNKSTELFRIEKVALELPIVESGFVKNKSSQSIEKTTLSYSNERLQHDILKQSYENQETLTQRLRLNKYIRISDLFQNVRTDFFVKHSVLYKNGKETSVEKIFHHRILVPIVN